MRPTVLLPPATLSTVQVAAPPPGTVAVNCFVCETVREAFVGDTLIEPLVTVTVAVAGALVPDDPLQVRV